MSHYAIGDVQGCYHALMDLLEHIQFDPERDELWFAGDMVNRGPDSLAVVRFIMSLPRVHCVLGNHDLHLLALAYGHPYQDHTMFDILQADDRDEIVHWFRQQPLLHYDEQLGYAMAHAGIFPHWELAQACQYAAEVQQVLQSDDCAQLLDTMYGDKPDQWDESLRSWERYRFIINCFTRMRFVTKQGALNLNCSLPAGQQPADLVPWFAVPQRPCASLNIIFGHWAALEGKASLPHLYALDTGCVYGNCLTALRLEDQQRFSVDCERQLPITLK